MITFKREITFFLICFCLQAKAQLNWAPTGIPLHPSSILCLYNDTVHGALYTSGNICNSPGNLGTQSICKYDGTIWDTLGIFTGGVNSVIIYQDTLFAGGWFSSINGQAISFLSKYDGSAWLPCGNFDGPIYNFRVMENELYACGGFSNVDGSAINGIAKWNGMQWADVFSFPVPNCSIQDVIEYKGEIFVSGNFDDTPMDMHDLAVYKSGAWQKVGLGLTGFLTGIPCMEVFQNELYIAGLLLKSEGNLGSGIQKWDGFVWSEVGTGLQDINNSYDGTLQVHDLCINNNGMYVVGTFYFAGNVPAHGLAKWDGSKWCGFGTSDLDYFFSAINFYQDTMYVAYAGDSLYNMFINKLAKWTGGNFVDTCGNTTGIQSEINNFETGISIYPNPSSGKFTIRSSEKIEAIEIYNVLGEKIFYTETYTSEMDVSQQPAGVYFLIARTKDDLFSKKIIKQ